MLLAALIFSGVVLAGQSNPGPSNHQVILPDPNRAGNTMSRFDEMADRRMFDDYRRERRRQAYEAAVINDRMQLAEQLDLLIGANKCDEASAMAMKAGYRDIRDGVERACRVSVAPQND